MAKTRLSRRKLLKAAAYGSIFSLLPQASQAEENASIGLHELRCRETEGQVLYRLTIKRQNLLLGSLPARPITINNTFPGPVIRLKQGKEAVIQVRNELSVSTSVHWHGIILPYEMDGVPGVVFPGIPPGQTFTYRFPVRQSGTYWYHSHTGLQEQLGHYGPLICDPAEPEPFTYHREHVLLLSDWTYEEPEEVLMHLKKWEGYYNYHKLTLSDLLRDIEAKGFLRTLGNRSMWARMRMNPTDIADVTGATYTYLLNGSTHSDNPPFLFKPGECVRLRIINASAATYFDFRIPGLELTVVQADGQNVKPVTVDELRIAVAETFDVLVTPREDKAYPIFAEAMDRSGFALGSLTFDANNKAAPPPTRPPFRRTMAMAAMPMHSMTDMKQASCGDCSPANHQGLPFGPDAAMVVDSPACMLDKPGDGLSSDRRVLSYADLEAVVPISSAPPSRTYEIHLTGNMERFIWKMWAWDGRNWTSRFEQLLEFPLGKTVRLIFINHTMMDHPIHLHGMWMRLQNGRDPSVMPRKHTVNLKPAEKLCVNVDADAFGNWAFHCHILYHMHTGMFRVVRAC